MRAPVPIVLCALALGAGACATLEAPAPTPAVVAPAPIEGYDWFYHQQEGEARLVYGLAESDDLGLGLDCVRASGRLILSALGGPDARPEVQIQAGEQTGRFPAHSEPSMLHDGVFLTAEASADAPVFKRFRREGWLSLWRESVWEAYVPHPGSTPNIERFFAFCG